MPSFLRTLFSFLPYYKAKPKNLDLFRKFCEKKFGALKTSGQMRSAGLPKKPTSRSCSRQRLYTDVQGFEVFTSSLFCGFSGNLDFNYQSNLRNLNIDNVFVCLIAFDGLFVTRNVDIFRRNYQFTPSNMYVILLAVPFVQRYA